jgi:uncharacterized protein
MCFGVAVIHSRAAGVMPGGGARFVAAWTTGEKPVNSPSGLDNRRWLTLTGRSVLTVAALGLGLAGGGLHAEIPSDALRKSLRPTADVNDFAGILDPGAKGALEQQCQELRQKTGAQLAVVILRSLQGGQIDDFTNKLFQEWGVGERGKNNGVMLLVALDDRKARIEVGYGLEPILPDALAGRILREQLFPAFKQERYSDGLKAAVGRIVDIIVKGEPASAADRLGVAPVPFGMQVALTAFLSVFIAIGSFLAGAGFGSRTAFFVLFGLFFGGIPFTMGCLTAAPLAPLVHTALAAWLGIVGWRVGRKNPNNFRQSRRRMRGGFDDGWIWGPVSSSSSGGWSSGGFSSSSGSFGGGSSGGGGASGSW